MPNNYNFTVITVFTCFVSDDGVKAESITSCYVGRTEGGGFNISNFTVQNCSNPMQVSSRRMEWFHKFLLDMKYILQSCFSDCNFYVYV